MKHLPHSMNYDALAARTTTKILAAFIKRDIRAAIKAAKR
jgi:hypothetical protein